MTRCRLPLLILILVIGLSSGAEAASYPLIIQIPPTISVRTIADTLGGTVVDSIPGAGVYLLTVPVVPLPDRASLLGIRDAFGAFISCIAGCSLYQSEVVPDTPNTPR